MRLSGQLDKLMFPEYFNDTHFMYIIQQKRTLGPLMSVLLKYYPF